MVSFHPTSQKSENLFSMGSFGPKYIGLSYKYTEELYFVTLNSDTKFKLTLVSKMAWEIGWAFIRTLKSLKNCTLMDSFCTKHMFQPENFIGIKWHDTEEWCKV